MRIYVHTTTYSLMFTTALFMITKNWKPKWALAGERVIFVVSLPCSNKETIYCHSNYEAHSIILSERSQASRLQNLWFHLDEILKMGKYTDRKQISECQELEIRGEDWMQRGLRKLFGGTEIVHLVIEVVVIQLYIFVNTLLST